MERYIYHTIGKVRFTIMELLVFGRFGKTPVAIRQRKYQEKRTEIVWLIHRSGDGVRCGGSLNTSGRKSQLNPGKLFEISK